MTAVILLILLFALKFNYQTVYLDYLISFVLLISLVSLGICLVVKKLLILDIDADDRWFKEGDSIKLKMMIDSPSFHTDIIPIVELKCLQTSETQTQILPCEDSGTVFEFRDLKPGTMVLSVEKVRVSGFFGLVKLYKKLGFEKQFNVYPKKAPVNYRYVRKTFIPGEGEILNAKGDDYTEIFEVRPIQEGDDLKHAHRALSAKYDEYIIKVGSDSRKSLYTYYLGDGEEFSVMLDLLGQVVELREKMIKDEGAYITAIYKGVQKELVFDSQLYELIDEVYRDYIPQEEKP
jgi:uncharacterized protein (DUF58 family)